MHNRLKRTLKVVVGVLVFSFGTTGCASNEIRWAEEVLLHDGKIVQVKRRTELTDTGFPVQKRGFEKFHELCFPPLGVYWKSNVEYRPSVFDIVDGKVYVKVPLETCTECMLHNNPKWSALYFEWNGGGWKKVDESESLKSLRFNLLSASHYLDDGARDARGLITLAEKEKRDASLYRRMKNAGRTEPGVTEACTKCIEGRPNTTRTSEVFVRSDYQSCNW